MQSSFRFFCNFAVNQGTAASTVPPARTSGAEREGCGHHVTRSETPSNIFSISLNLAGLTRW